MSVASEPSARLTGLSIHQPLYGIIELMTKVRRSSLPSSSDHHLHVNYSHISAVSQNAIAVKNDLFRHIFCFLIENFPARDDAHLKRVKFELKIMMATCMLLARGHEHHAGRKGHHDKEGLSPQHPLRLGPARLPRQHFVDRHFWV